MSLPQMSILSELPSISTELPSNSSEFENDVQISGYEEKDIPKRDDTIVDDEGESDDEDEFYDEDEYLALCFYRLKKILGKPRLTDEEALARAFLGMFYLEEIEATLRANNIQNGSERPKRYIETTKDSKSKSTELNENKEKLTDKFHKLDTKKKELIEQTNISCNSKQKCGIHNVSVNLFLLFLVICLTLYSLFNIVS